MPIWIDGSNIVSGVIDPLFLPAPQVEWPWESITNAPAFQPLLGFAPATNGVPITEATHAAICATWRYLAGPRSTAPAGIRPSHQWLPVGRGSNATNANRALCAAGRRSGLGWQSRDAPIVSGVIGPAFLPSPQVEWPWSSITNPPAFEPPLGFSPATNGAPVAQANHATNADLAADWAGSNAMRVVISDATNALASTDYVATAIAASLRTNFDTVLVTNALSASNLTATSTFQLPVYTVATLPAGAAGQEAYCTDMLSPWGTGGRVIHNGTNWICARTGVIATTSLETFALSCWQNGVSLSTPQQESYMTPSGNKYARDYAAGGGALSTSQNGLDCLTTSTPAAGSYINSAPSIMLAANSVALIAIGNITLGTGTDPFFWQFGFGVTTTNNVYNQIAVVYDPFNMRTNGATGSETNQFRLGVYKSGVATNWYSSGLTMSTTIPARLALTVTASRIALWTNGNTTVPAVTDVNIPQSQLYFNHMIAKGGGAGARLVYFNNWYSLSRRLVPLTIP